MDVTFSICKEATGRLMCAVRDHVKRTITEVQCAREELDAIRRWIDTPGNDQTIGQRMLDDAAENLDDVEAALSSWCALYRALAKAHRPHEDFVQRVCAELGIAPPT